MATFTKAQLLELLKDFPDDASIEVPEMYDRAYDQGSYFVDLDPEKHFEVLDFRKEAHKESQFYNQVFIRLGTV